MFFKNQNWIVKNYNWTVSKIRTELLQKPEVNHEKSELNCENYSKNWTVSSMGHRSNNHWVEFKRYCWSRWEDQSCVCWDRQQGITFGQYQTGFAWIESLQMEQYSPVWEGGSSREHSSMLMVSWDIWKKTVECELFYWNACLYFCLHYLIFYWSCQSQLLLSQKCRIQTQVFCFIGKIVIAFDKERLNSAVSVENFGLSIHGHQFGPPKKIFRGKIIQGEWRNFHWAHALFLAGVKFHILPCVLVCFLVEFDLLFAFSVLSCRIVDCASLFIYVPEHDCLCFPMLTVETAVFDCNCWLSSSHNR